MRTGSRGFTLVEMVAVVAIVGVLAVAAHPVLELTTRRSQEMQLRSALRSHDSPPQAPAPGRDVFDVMSRSTGSALDGTRYDSW